VVSRRPVALAIACGVFVWSGLVGTIALSARGGSMLFVLTPTLAFSLPGHLIYGGALGVYLRRATRNLQPTCQAANVTPTPTRARHRPVPDDLRTQVEREVLLPVVAARRRRGGGADALAAALTSAAISSSNARARPSASGALP
jgi:hypothetical protein